ncbi:Protein of unknown function [Geodermatophilus sabuli]|uniref:DUF559 domain-containing protein n=2 Tax=Geodermatophilus sabuli TaxID=1564158 RepID=A0A285EBN6_9ACTN|nr:Protein of unknown function [Geodermatophilus sabuli]
MNHPELAAQFDVAANGGITPDQVVAGTNRKLWWACSVAPDHRWEASGVNRVRGRGCPWCTVVAVSIREVRLAAELAAVFPGLDVEDRRVELPGRRALEADILDRERRLVVEYDGEYWHAGEDKEQRDREKTALLTEAGYTVIRVREAALCPLAAADVVVGEDDAIDVVTAAVLDRVAEFRPDLLTAEQPSPTDAAAGPSQLRRRTPAWLTCAPGSRHDPAPEERPAPAPTRRRTRRPARRS